MEVSQTNRSMIRVSTVIPKYIFKYFFILVVKWSSPVYADFNKLSNVSSMLSLPYGSIFAFFIISCDFGIPRRSRIPIIPLTMWGKNHQTGPISLESTAKKIIPTTNKNNSRLGHQNILLVNSSIINSILMAKSMYCKDYFKWPVVGITAFWIILAPIFLAYAMLLASCFAFIPNVPFPDLSICTLLPSSRSIFIWSNKYNIINELIICRIDIVPK